MLLHLYRCELKSVSNTDVQKLVEVAVKLRRESIFIWSFIYVIFIIHCAAVLHNTYSVSKGKHGPLKDLRLRLFYYK